jgi:hypothetical protein
MIAKKEGLAENLILHKPVQQKNAPRKKLEFFCSQASPLFPWKAPRNYIFES